MNYLAEAQLRPRPDNMANEGGGGDRPLYSCKTASETLEWINAIIDFLKPYRFFLDAHVVNFFKDRLWEDVDKDWMDCMRNEPVEKLVQIPCGLVQDHWPTSLREFVLASRSLSVPHELADLKEAFPGLRVSSLNKVIAQGMNQKKKHEVEALAAVVDSITRRVGAGTVVDVGSGQGYLAQVLSFEHELSVVAIDASSHHGNVTDARAKRIEKYYASRTSETQQKHRPFSRPRTVTCQVLSTAMLKGVCSSLSRVDNLEKPNLSREKVGGLHLEGIFGGEYPSSSTKDCKCSLVLAGLHACGDLSVTMLRTFVECDQVKALINLGCCYNLLSEEGIKETDGQCGFPVSAGVKSAGFLLGKNARDLACQSAERWRCLGEDAGFHNFELHVFRAAFQMVLHQYHPEIIMRSPTIGHQGKSLHRQQNRRILEANAIIAGLVSKKNYKPAISCNENTERNKSGSTLVTESLLVQPSYPIFSNDEPDYVDRYWLFAKFCKSGLDRLGLHDLHDSDLLVMWKEAAKFSELVGPYWTLRAALGPVLETLMLLDRLLFLQKQDNILEAIMLPLFDPVLSPRNVALIAVKA